MASRIAERDRAVWWGPGTTGRAGNCPGPRAVRTRRPQQLVHELSYHLSAGNIVAMDLQN